MFYTAFHILFWYRSLTHPLIPWYRALLVSLTVLGLSRYSSHFMEPEASLSCSQERATGRCLESDEFISHCQIYFNTVLLCTRRSPKFSLPFMFLASCYRY